jgi:hypothetical protein
VIICRELPAAIDVLQRPETRRHEFSGQSSITTRGLLALERQPVRAGAGGAGAPSDDCSCGHRESGWKQNNSDECGENEPANQVCCLWFLVHVDDSSGLNGL